MRNEDVALFESKGVSKSMLLCRRAFAGSTSLAILSVWLYRCFYFVYDYQSHAHALVWIGMFAAEVWFGLCWLLTQASRWNLIYRRTFKDKLSYRHEKELPGIDIFGCTADPTIEPPIMVINTVLSVMAYDYPSEKLSVYLSDDGGSDITFYVLTLASTFAKHWIPYCKKYKLETPCPAAYFSNSAPPTPASEDWASIRELYEEMKNRIQSVTELGGISKELRLEHNGFTGWESFSSPRDHDTILHILIGVSSSREVKGVDGCALPNLIYLAREKRPQHPHNFKAGAINSLIRVSEQMSNGPVILTLDCDMYSNSTRSLRDALCFFMDEEKGYEIAFVQFPQSFENVTRNDIYGSSLRTDMEVDFHGMDGFGGSMYIGTGCFHRRDTLCGRVFSKSQRDRGFWRKGNDNQYFIETAYDLEERLKDLASCTFEKDTQWGTEMGLKYGCAVEDVITGLSIQCNGWKSVYYNPERKGFLGLAPTSLHPTLVQHKRWSEGDLQILLSKYNPASYGFRRIHPGLIMGYYVYILWAPSSLPTLYYCIIPSLHLLIGNSLFPQISSLWIIPYAYIIFSAYAYSLAEFLWSGGTFLAWWNDQRMWLYKRTSSYFFALVDTISRLVKYSSTTFTITSKVADQDAYQRYEQDIMDFETPSPMITILVTLAMLNLFCLAGLAKQLLVDFSRTLETMILQIIQNFFLVVINLPLYEALFERKDKGKVPSSVTVKSVFLALLACACFTFLH
ncbi:hypothetical protein DCAR_0311181 [Daucus carota subsp. sativus]|uniref:Cellulose synthase-like protein E1 n=1 Tax=Daucus carota subsp. sativus TaxID=79200 RepID=A0AAF0WMA1_DAUCS|nr:PREDICTED: cellulose synthase-like protein E1 [Daucus carota subsp. sativus]WOG91926.1 hypothetical protein DCAR_0311181 [Daucus carota subsp. sativus]